MRGMLKRWDDKALERVMQATLPCGVRATTTGAQDEEVAARPEVTSACRARGQGERAQRRHFSEKNIRTPGSRYLNVSRGSQPFFSYAANRFYLLMGTGAT